jgi:hypothetical protein
MNLKDLTDWATISSSNLFPWHYSPNLDLGPPPWNSPFHFGFLDLRQSVGLFGGWSTRRKASTCTQTLNIHALSGIRTNDPVFRASEDSACLRPLGYRDRPVSQILWPI